jgi:uncharacterized protein (TIGR03435 family)
MRFALTLIILGCTAGTLTLPASQSSSGAQDAAPAFQLVSVRRATAPTAAPTCVSAATVAVMGNLVSGLPPCVQGSISALPGGRFEARQQTVETLARVAYGFEHISPNHGVVVSFGLARNDLFDVTAIANEEWTTPPDSEEVPPELRTMLRAMLEERFQLKARIVTKKAGAYALRLVDRRSGPGPGLRRSASDCVGPFTQPPADARDTRLRCRFVVEPHRIEADGVTMADVARIISGIDGVPADRLVVDDTGLKGTYDLSLSLTVITVDKGTTSVPIAVREHLKDQLGLKLETAKLPVSTLVIDQAKSPRED